MRRSQKIKLGLVCVSAAFVQAIFSSIAAMCGPTTPLLVFIAISGASVISSIAVNLLTAAAPADQVGSAQNTAHHHWSDRRFTSDPNTCLDAS
ncbi:hypothetical protein M1L60_10800 [Actinoplanes sp. TRM 88003]|uniref:Uncharacterized protein n=1 Tax=Paractinoplanes aksuensis TaxID=2939490 RepID=A0ABT1DJR7_9ACTN|nr:hypothetical protein [Actinoplanes aksuensis]MCO8271081.1 hypothetical protein [Actinoplanes aksuensis]